MTVRGRGGVMRRRGLVFAALGLVSLTLVSCAAPHEQDPPALSVTAAPDPVADDAKRRLAELTLTDKVASLLMLHQPGTDAAALRSFAAGYGLGGLILMRDNIPGSAGAMRAMTAAASVDPDLPLLIGIDQEGGEVSRMADDLALGADALRSLPPQAAQDAFRSRSTLLRSVGVNVNFGIVADVTADPQSFLYGRVLGTDPDSASDRVAAAVAGEQGQVLSTLKHFPGHGAAPGDSHRSIPVTPLGYRDWMAREAPPFRAGIAAGAEVVMFGLLTYSSVDQQPAGLSPVWHDILRSKLGFTGVTITDDMLMLQHSGRPEYADPVENA
ncbi:MAG: glycoside hydrolase family 3 protein, partial [Ramlibacter sp.]|nr:glycoside hydrolase family 3 protein [Cryobacterium sp.]